MRAAGPSPRCDGRKEVKRNADLIKSCRVRRNRQRRILLWSAFSQNTDLESADEAYEKEILPSQSGKAPREMEEGMATTRSCWVNLEAHRFHQPPPKESCLMSSGDSGLKPRIILKKCNIL